MCWNDELNKVQVGRSDGPARRCTRMLSTLQSAPPPNSPAAAVPMFDNTSSRDYKIVHFARHCSLQEPTIKASPVLPSILPDSIHLFPRPPATTDRNAFSGLSHHPPQPSRRRLGRRDRQAGYRRRMLYVPPLPLTPPISVRHSPRPSPFLPTALPSTLPLDTLTSTAQGIHFSPCPPSSASSPSQLALVSIDPDSPLRQQLFDIDAQTLDAYWLEQYVRPRAGAGEVRCWQEQAGACTRFGLGPGLQKPPGGGGAEQVVQGSVRSNEGM